jgi:pilus assembly protein CpaE
MYPLSVAVVVSTSELWDEIQTTLQKLPARVVVEQAEIGELAVFLDKIQRTAADVVFLDVSNIMETLPELARQIRSLPTSPEIIAVHGGSDAETILHAVRSGAREYLYPPLGPSLEKALERIAEERQHKHEAQRTGGRSLGFLSAKGGCGATTLACHTAIELPRQTGQETLLMDLDLSAGIVRLLMKSRSRYSIVDALNNVNRLDASYWRALVSNGIKGLEVIAATAEDSPRETPAWPGLQHVLRFARSQYNWLIVDLGRGSSTALFSALEELDELFLVTTLEVPSLHQARQMIECLNRRGYERHRIRLVVNRMTRRSEVTSQDVEKIAGVPVYGVIPNDYQALYEAYSGGELLPLNSPVNRRIAALAAKITGAEEQPRKRAFSIFG